MCSPGWSPPAAIVQPLDLLAVRDTYSHPFLPLTRAPPTVMPQPLGHRALHVVNGRPLLLCHACVHPYKQEQGDTEDRAEGEDDMLLLGLLLTAARARKQSASIDLIPDEKEAGVAVER